MSEKIAVIRIRGTVRLNTPIIDTLTMLKLHRKHICVIYPKTSSVLGMVHKVENYVTWGEVSEETYKELVAKRGVKDAEGKLKPFFRLNPPRGGFERGGIKQGFGKGGVLGYRGAQMNDLIKKML